MIYPTFPRFYLRENVHVKHVLNLKLATNYANNHDSIQFIQMT